MTELTPFNYSELDAKTSDFLKQKEENMSRTLSKAYTDLGRELKEAQNELSNNRSGIFEEWYRSLGFSKGQVNRLINRYDFIVSNWDDKEAIESIPISLSYEISKPSATKEQQRKVLDGEIKTLKEFKEHTNVNKINELDKITTEIKIHLSHLNTYKQWFIETMEKVRRQPQNYQLFIESLNLQDHNFAKELREPTNDEFFNYIIGNIEKNFHDEIDKLNL